MIANDVAAKELIFSNACPRDSIPLTFLEISDKEACERVLSDLDAVLIASDSDVPVKPGVLNTVMPEGPDEKSKVMRGCHAATGNRALPVAAVRFSNHPFHCSPQDQLNTTGD